ncbi:Hsp70 family protein [Methanosarcina barkeri]|uniref:Hsp70 family protein n=1 Tax=Methanosarcina barkeri TaxID=2208 RepID=UPI000AE9640F|nr:Hsp70 family protein [Methanosarcina barkeri]
MAKYVYGIDLGTTYSCIAYVDESGRANVIKNLEGTNTTPSVVNFASPNQVVVGQVAKETAVIDPKNTVSLVKTLMGKSNFAINYNDEDKSPEEVSAYILRKLAEDAAKEIDAEVKDVVITCPAYFGTAERTATKNAGIIAGLNVLEIISEPVAAAIYYGCTKEPEEKTILVYDLGGGTFDVTIMSINSEKIEIICSDGDHDLGGKDWDSATMRYLADEFASQKSYDGDFDEYAQQDLRLKAEKAKQQLSAKEKTPVIVEAAGERARIDFFKRKI